jgi:formiminotetrahydrofolate cyclodeaminase
MKSLWRFEVVSFMIEVNLIELPTRILLEKFGAGSHVPGSGSAAALMGLLASSLVLTVSKLTLEKATYSEHHAKIKGIEKAISSKLDPLLQELFQRDTIIFNEVIKARNARKNATDENEKHKYGELALEKLKPAIEIPFQISEVCFSLVDYGLDVFDIGFKSARGDSGAAISAAIAGAMAAVFVINLNLKSFNGNEWAIQQQNRCDEIYRLIIKKQSELSNRMLKVRGVDFFA